MLEDNHSPPSTAKVCYERSCTCTPPVCLHGVDRQGKFYVNGTMHRNSMSINVQQDAAINSLFYL